MIIPRILLEEYISSKCVNLKALLSKSLQMPGLAGEFFQMESILSLQPCSLSQLNVLHFCLRLSFKVI